jgi:predicted Zn-dependent protease
MMKNMVLFILLFAITGCSTVPLTGRKQPPMPPVEYMVQQSELSYQQVLEEGNLSTDPRQTEQLQRVGGRIAEAVELFMVQNNMADRVDDFKWEFNLIDEDIPNAWCMPGGKVAFYTGILPFTKDETGMAVVMGHEIAHAVARHGSERLAYQVGQQGFGALLSWGTQDSDYHDAYMQLYGIGTQVGFILPYSRTHESEADRMGLIFMAMAGYNPEAAISFWQRMAASNPDAPPEFLSTHPSDETRIRRLREHMPEALRYYRP